MIQLGRLLVFGAFLALVSTAHAAPTCTGLVGTCTATYTISTTTFTDTFVITGVNATSGVTTARDEYSYPMTGYCKNGTVYLTERYATYYLGSYYFTQGTTPRFGRHFGTSSVMHDFDTYPYTAAMRKVSSFTKVAQAAALSVATRESIQYEKFQELQRAATQR